MSLSPEFRKRRRTWSIVVVAALLGTLVWRGFHTGKATGGVTVETGCAPERSVESPTEPPGPPALAPAVTGSEPLPVRPAALRGITGRVLARGDRPAPGLVVTFTSIDREGRSEVVTTGENGGFALDAAAPGRYRAEIPGLLVLELTAPARDVILRLDAAVLSGRIFAPDGTLARGAELVLAKALPGAATSRWTDESDAGATFDGAFSVTYDTPGAYVLFARARSTRIYEQRLQLGAEGDTHDVRLVEAARFGGRVIDADGAPVGGALVEATSAPGRSEGATSTDASGRFLLESRFEEELTITARAGGKRSTAITVRSPTVDAKLVLAEAAPQVRGRIVDPRGWPIERFALDGASIHTPDGRFVWTAPRAGRLQVRLSGEFATRELDVTTTDGATTDVGDVPVEPRAKLVGRLLALRTSTPGHCSIGARTATDGFAGTVARAGTYAIDVPAGAEVTLSAHCDEGFVTRVITCGSGTCSTDLPLDPGGSLRLRLPAIGGPAVLRVTGPSQFEEEVALNDVPRTISGLVPGNYSVERLARRPIPPVVVVVTQGNVVEVVAPSP